jgi:AraC family transcriptional regulator
MNTQPRIEILQEKKLIGSRIRMSFASDRTRDLWRGFMPRLKEIPNRIDSNLYSVEIYHPQFFINFNPNIEFEKWAAIEVSDYESIPGKMESLTLPVGTYAVFIHTGPASEGPKTYQYIFGTWIPNSDFILDERPHFALMGEKYKNEDPKSEEEIWIPIKPK